jgi:hypothetical protein
MAIPDKFPVLFDVSEQKYYYDSTLDGMKEAANAGGGGGSSGGLESYQNSAMSSAVMAYVYRDESDNIYGVYEPIRNNDVSRSVFAYADSIDLFPFDNIYCKDNSIIDFKILNWSNRTIYKGCQLTTMLIDMIGVGSNPITFSSINQGDKKFTIAASFGDITGYLANIDENETPLNIYGSTGNDGQYSLDFGNSSFDGTNTILAVNEAIPSSIADGGFSGLQLINHVHRGYYGDDSLHGAELYITGDNSTLQENNVGCAAYIDSVGDNAIIAKCDMLGYVEFEVNDKSFLHLNECYFGTAAYLGIQQNNVDVTSNRFDAGSAVDIFNNTDSLQANHFMPESSATIVAKVSQCKIGYRSTVDSTTNSLFRCGIEDFTSYTPASDQSGKKFSNIDGVVYLIGVTGGAVTATAV